jgi:beta-lactamase regulating signal transducer with metallopeptidase domain
MEMLRELLLDPSPSAVLTVSLLKASMVLALAQLLALAAPRLSAAAKHLLLTAGLASFLVIPLLAFFGPALPVTIETPAVAPVMAVPVTWTAPASLPQPVDDAPPVDLPALLWMLVAAGVLARLMRSAFRLRSITAGAEAPSPRLVALLKGVQNTTAPVRLLQSDRVSVPMVWGVRAGTLLLPSSAETWSDEELRATFVHELGHLQRLDYVSLALMNVVAALLWFQPQVWLARRQALLQGERACDDLVLRAGERPSAYASHLLQVARQVRRREPLAELLAMSRPSQLEGRMVAILSPSINRQTLGGKLLMISLVTFLAVVVPLTAVRITAQPAVVAPATPAVVAPAPPPVVRVVPAIAPAVSAPPAVASVAAVKPVPAVPAIAAHINPAPVALVEPVLAAEPVEATPAVLAHVGVAPVEAVAPVLSPVPDVHSVPATLAVPAVAPVVPAVPAVPPYAVRALTPAEIGDRPFRVVASVEARGYTLKLNRPVNTGDPSRNPAETVAIERLLRKASARKADALTNVKCMREIQIGLVWPTSVVCQADAIAFE